MLQGVAGCCSVLQCVAACCSVLQCVAVCCSVLQCVAVRCSMMLCVAVCVDSCSHVTTVSTESPGSLWTWNKNLVQCVAVCCSVLQCVPVRCSVLQCVLITSAMSQQPLLSRQDLLGHEIRIGRRSCAKRSNLSYTQRQDFGGRIRGRRSHIVVASCVHATSYWI